MSKPLPGQPALMPEVMGFEIYKGRMPRILAFADVHLGTHKYPIREHIIDAMAQIVVAAQDLKPDVILFAGDAFKHRVPAAVDVTDFGRFLYALSEHAEVIAVPGNHDITGHGATTIGVYGLIGGVHVYTEPQVIDMKDYQIVVMPWLPQKALSSFGLEAQDNAGSIRALLQLLKLKMRPGVFSILLAHCTALGTEYHDEASTILGSDVLWTSDMFFEGFDLCVLGHLHKPQEVPGTDNAFYTGSICPVSFNESGQEKSFIYFDEGGVRRKPLETPVFLSIPETSLVQHLRDTERTFIQVKREHDEPDPEMPPCLYYEIVPLPPERDLRQRLDGEKASTLTPRQAIIAWLELEGKEDDGWAVLELAEKLMKEE